MDSMEALKIFQFILKMQIDNIIEVREIEQDQGVEKAKEANKFSDAILIDNLFIHTGIEHEQFY
jgi:hypothetical protein